MTDWAETFRGYGWTSCVSSKDPSDLVVGIAHPQYGLLRLHVTTTTCETLVELSRRRRGSPSVHPVLDVAVGFLRDMIHGEPRVIVGILYFLDSEGMPAAAPMTLSRHHDGSWLPYWETDPGDGWVTTGWDEDGTARHDFKPAGWDGELLGSSPAHDASTQASYA